MSYPQFANMPQLTFIAKLTTACLSPVGSVTMNAPSVWSKSSTQMESDDIKCLVNTVIANEITKLTSTMKTNEYEDDYDDDQYILLLSVLVSITPPLLGLF